MAAMMQNCERCERPIPMGAGVCPYCRRRQDAPARRALLGRVALVTVLAAIVLMAAHWLSGR